MYGQRRVNDGVHWYLSELSARVVAESGRPNDRFHLGKLILQGLKDEPNFLLQIDGATGESETSGSVMERSVRCAEAFKELGLKCGDIIILMAPNHLDLCIPYYAALYVGLAIAPIDRTLGIKELQQIFSVDEPKIIFCQSERAKDVRTALKNCHVESKVITFDEEQEKLDDAICLKDFLKKYGSDTKIDNFIPSDFDPEGTIAILVSTSGTTGLPKQAICTHKNWAMGQPYLLIPELNFPYPTRMCMLVSPIQWITAMLQFNLSALTRYTRLQSSKDVDQQHAFHMINTYKPTFMIISPTALASYLKPSKGKCDWTSFENIIVGGGAVSQEMLNEFKEMAPNTQAVNAYGMSELTGMGFMAAHDRVPRSSGKFCGHLQYRLVTLDTKKDILEPNVSGELWMKGPSVVKGYYKNPEATKEAFTEDGWFKSGDMFYRDENWNFFFVERIKMLLKYRNHQVSPVEIQEVIKTHPGVLDVVVTGIPDYECGDLPVACVVKRPGGQVTAQEIKDLVKENLTDTKQLRGGVVFLESLPMTATGKLDTKKIKDISIAEFRKRIDN